MRFTLIGEGDEAAPARVDIHMTHRQLAAREGQVIDAPVVHRAVIHARRCPWQRERRPIQLGNRLGVADIRIAHDPGRLYECDMQDWRVLAARPNGGRHAA